MNTQDIESNDLNIILKGVISGFLIAYLVILGLRPTAEYPDNILEIIDNPWIYVILIIINFYALQWDLTIGLLLMLSIIALILDVIIFTEGEIFNNNSNIENFKDETTTTTTSSSGPKPSGPTSSEPTSSGPTSSGPTSSQQNSEANSDNEEANSDNEEANSDSEEANSDSDLSPQQGPTPSNKKPISINDKINNIESNQYAINSKIDNIGQKVTDIKFYQSASNRDNNIQGTEIIKKTDENKQNIDNNKKLLNELIEKLEDLESDDDLDETKEYIDEIAIKLTEQNNKTKEILTNIAAKLDKMNSKKKVSKIPAIKKPIRIRRKRPIKQYSYQNDLLKLKY